LIILATHPITFQIPHLNLQEGEISKNLDVILFPLEGISVALDALIIFLVRALKETVDMPAYM